MNPQQQSRQRKLICIGLIIALFTISLMHRRFILETQAFDLQLREQARGEVELTSSAVRLTLFGSRGIASCVLWQMAIEKQKKHQWNELELLVRSIAKLQPHFVSPWLFQSWNLSFNVAVECDRSRDKFFYVSRGLELLAEGERRNQGTIDDDVLRDSKRIRFPGNPEMRFYMGFYYQLKITISDERNEMQALFDMSCIDPLERDPGRARFWKVDAARNKVVDLELFKQFCDKNPRLIRRLREKLDCQTPKQVLSFLEENRNVPSRYEVEASPDPNQTTTPLKQPARLQFPILPPPRMADLPDPNAREPLANQDFDVYAAIKAWYTYAMEPLPPLPTDFTIDETFDPVRYRVPKMMLIIFRGYPARAQVGIAEARQQDGWIDEKGWQIVDWFKDTKQEDVRVGGESKYHAREAWKIAYDMYLKYGRENGLYFSPDERQRMVEQSKLYRDYYGVRQEEGNTAPRPEDEKKVPGLAESYKVHSQLYWSLHNRRTTNFDGFLHQADVERRPEMAEVRRLLFDAADLRSLGRTEPALAAYRAGLARWQQVFLAHRGYRELIEIQMEMYEMELAYLRLLQRHYPTEFKAVAQLGLYLAIPEPILTPRWAALGPLLWLDNDVRSRIIPIRRIQGPLDLVATYESQPNQLAAGDVLTAITAATQLGLQGSGLAQAPIPLPVVSWETDALLLGYISRGTAPIPSYWLPLIQDESINRVRDSMRLEPITLTHETSR